MQLLYYIYDIDVIFVVNSYDGRKLNFKAPVEGVPGLYLYMKEEICLFNDKIGNDFWK